MKVFFVPLFLSPIALTDPIDPQFDDSVINYDFMGSLNTEFNYNQWSDDKKKWINQNNVKVSVDDQLKKDIKAGLDDEILRSFGIDALNIGQRKADRFDSSGSLIKRGASLSIPYVLTPKEIWSEISKKAAQRARDRSDRKARLKQIYAIAAETARIRSNSEGKMEKTSESDTKMMKERI